MPSNDFSAIRISIASPDQVRAWSYGEVTKPETINYRNQKPEKDGLFDERIFGPTKDFECYCGKYKRIRYRGVICDRCGVEVTRAKVRRERMGHINLAAPVAHIWFAKGTPGWLGLLLDMVPRNLERVLYYAQYMVTKVDEEEKQRLLDSFIDNEGQITEVGEAEKNDAVNKIRTVMSEVISEIDSKTAELEQSIETSYADSLKPIRDAGKIAQEFLDGNKRKRNHDGLSLLGRTIVEPKKTVAKIHNEVLATVIDELLLEATGEEGLKIATEIKDLNAEKESILITAENQIIQVSKAASDRLSDGLKSLDDQRAEIESILQLTTLTENRYRELKDSYPKLFTAGMGAEALMDSLDNLDLETIREKLFQEATDGVGQKAKKAAKRLRVVEAFRKSGSSPSWMVLSVLPVLPPDLRPMVQLDGGRFATSDLNDLYRRVINRNNRLRRLMKLGAPEIIIRNEKRMLQEAVDALIDNGRRGRTLTGSHNHKLKSLSDMLRGKQGRFRQNLLGKRVDYSGRSVIVVGSALKLNQCGLPKKMALELFKPFVINRLVVKGFSPNIKSAKRSVERMEPEVWDLLEEVITERPVFLNRAPTLHRLGIQAFEPVLVEGNAIQIHPLVCAAYNADFDGDQMAVHVPIGRKAVAEARKLMLSTRNMLLPSSGDPVVTPTLDIVVGCYWLTDMLDDLEGDGNIYYDFDDAKLAHELNQIDIRARIVIKRGSAIGPNNEEVILLPRFMTDQNGVTELIQPDISFPLDDGWKIQEIETTIGRILFNQVFPNKVVYRNNIIDKSALKDIILECYTAVDNDTTALVLDDIKKLGFHFATESGLTIALSDINVPPEKTEMMEIADAKVASVTRDYQRGLMTPEEEEMRTIEIWQDVNHQMEAVINRRLPEFGNLFLMAGSGAKGNIAQIKQMVGMRGLMADPKGRILPLPIKSSFREGLTVLEYFISTHGARKGLADTALRTADSGYLTRRLIDVSQDMIANDLDCGTDEGLWVERPTEASVLGSIREHIVGRSAAAPIAHPLTGEILVEKNQEIDHNLASVIEELEIERVFVRSPLTCGSTQGLCRLCYGRSLARGKLVEKGEALGVIAAQSIGEPGTQLTMRTFHTGGIAGVDITSGLPRVEELFEARTPKLVAPIAEIDGVINVIEDNDGRHVTIINEEIVSQEHKISTDYRITVKTGDEIDSGTEISKPIKKRGLKPAEGEELVLPPAIYSEMAGTARVKGRKVTIEQFTTEERTYPVSPNIRLLVQSGERVKAGAALAEGPLNPQDVLRVRGKDAIQKYLVEEVQRVYRSQGVVIHDKHIEIIARQMLRNVRISYPGDTQFLHGELVDRSLWKAVNEKSIAEEKTPATAETVLLGVTKVSLSTESFLAAASFQETTRVLTEAALFGKIDMLKGLKENVIIGRLIPAQLDSQKEQDRLMDEALIEPVLNIEEEGQEDTDSTVTDEEEDGLRALAALLNSSLDEEANTAGENETPASPSE